jgi:hypothetical protein
MKKIEQPATHSTLQHPLLNAVCSDEPKHIHLLHLSDPVGPIHSLQIHLWIPKVSHALVMGLICVTLHIPVAVIENNNIGSSQIDTKSSSMSHEQKEDELLPAGSIIFINRIDTTIMFSPTINTTISYIAESVSQTADGPTNKGRKEEQ